MDGGCNCGEIRYRVTRAPLTAYICHCHLCQKRTGSAFSMQIVIPADGFELLAGTPMQKERILPDGKRNVSLVCRVLLLAHFHKAGRLSGDWHPRRNSGRH